jgi:pimeloyl-ACP methyl ester carboxylesterase
MDELTHRVTAWDGLCLHVREWSDSDNRLPLLCLPGIVRTGGDFAEVARRIGQGRRVIAPDYAGRGESDWSGRLARYEPEALLRDVLDICVALDLPHVVAVGTSFGGLLAMGLGAARPLLLRGVVLNDIGPALGQEGADFVRRFIAGDPALPDLDACAAFLKRHLPPLSLQTAQEWHAMAALTYEQGDDGLYHPNWDTRIAKLLRAPPRDLWPLFGALAHVPVMLVRGEASDILLEATVARMRQERPDMRTVSLPGIGHAPTMIEPPVVEALRDFLDALP